MKTEELIETLSLDPRRPASTASVGMMFLAALAAVAIVLPFSLWWLRPREDMAHIWADNKLFLLKVMFTMAVALATLPILQRLSVPGKPAGWAGWMAAAPFMVMFALAGYHFATHPAGVIWSALNESAWRDCLIEIPALAIPPFAIMSLLVRRYAPTNLVRTGAYIGLLAGGLGGFGYAMHCHDDDVAFVALVYTASMLLTAGLGALAGPYILRWK